MSEFLSDNEVLRTPEDYYRAAKKIEEGTLLKCQRYQVYCQFDIFNQLKEIIPEEESKVKWKWITDYNRHEAGYFRDIYPESVDYDDVNYDISLPSCHSVDPEPLFEQSLQLGEIQNPLPNNDSSLEPNNLDRTAYVKSYFPKFTKLDMVTNISLPIFEDKKSTQSTSIPVEIPSSPPPACPEDFSPGFNSKLSDNVYEDNNLNPYNLFDSANILIECLREAPQTIYPPVSCLHVNSQSSPGQLGSGGFGSEYENPLSDPFSSIGDNDHITKPQPSIVVKQDQSQIVISDNAPTENVQSPTLYPPNRYLIQESPPATSTATTSESADKPLTYTYANINSPQTHRKIATPVSPMRCNTTRKLYSGTVVSKMEPKTMQASPSRSQIMTRSKSKALEPEAHAYKLLTKNCISQTQKKYNATIMNTMQVIDHDELNNCIPREIHSASYFTAKNIKNTFQYLRSTQQPMCSKRPGKLMTSPGKRTKDCLSFNVAKRLSWVEADAEENDPIIKKKFAAPKKASSRELEKYDKAIEFNSVRKMKTRKAKH